MVVRSLSRPIYRVLIIAALFVSGCATPFVAPEHVSSVSVTFVEPEKFTDVRRTEWEHNSHGLLAALAKFMQETGERALPPEMQLSIKVTDVKLAGDFEPWLGVPFNQTRIIKIIYPPRIVLEFRLIDDNGRVIKEGKRELTDVDYQRRDTSLREDYLRYEKDLLRDWIREEFSALMSGKIG